MPAPQRIYTVLHTKLEATLTPIHAADAAVVTAAKHLKKSQAAVVAAIRLHRRAMQIAGGESAVADAHLAAAQQAERDASMAYQEALQHAIVQYRELPHQLAFLNESAE